MKKASVLAVVIFLVFLSGCGRAWNTANRSYLKDDINRILEVSAIELEVNNCQMIDSTRAGLCTLELTADEAETFIHTMQLTVPETEEHHQQVAIWQAAQGCRLSEGFWESETYQVYASQRRAVQGPEQVGAGLEYLLLFYNPDTGQSCIQLEYGYG